MIKNWTVTTQPVKNGTDGIASRERYILNENHPNHENTEKIISLFGSKETSRQISISGEQYRLNQKIKSVKGGRPLSSFAVEFCLTLPKGYRPSQKQWKEIVSECCIAISNKLSLSNEDKTQFAKQIRAVCHQQNQTTRNGSGDHVHLIIGKVVNDKVLTELQRKSITKTIKLAFNSAVLKELGLNVADYKPYEVNRGKKLECWRFQYEKSKKSFELQKLTTKLQRQAEKWFNAHIENDFKQSNRQFNRLKKSFGELSNLSCPEEDKEKLYLLKKKIEDKSKRIF